MASQTRRPNGSRIAAALGACLAATALIARAAPVHADAPATPDGLNFTTTKTQTDSGETVRAHTYRLPQNVWQLYPFKWLPKPYRKKYRELAKTVEHFTRQSLKRGGVEFRDVQVSGAAPSKRVRVRIVGGNGRDLRAFAAVHYQFFDKDHARQGKRGVKKCQNTPGCWDPNPGKRPWAFFPPVGLPLTGQKAVTLLDYPPADSLMKRDYLGNFTMDRWSRVLNFAGVSDPVRYETIVDSRPIAAPGSGQSKYMPAVSTYFNDPPNGPDYVVPMLKLLSHAAKLSPGRAKPVLVLGDPARKAWGDIIGRGGKVDVLAVGRTRLPGAVEPTPWVASNHPDVATYQCCPGDPASACSEQRDQHLPKMTRIDLQAACIVKTMANNPSQSPAAIKQMCKARWKTSPSPAHQRKFCVLARLGYNYDADGRQCKSKAKARRFCRYYNDNPCPQNVYKCTVPNQ